MPNQMGRGRKVVAASVLLATGMLGGAAYPSQGESQSESCQMHLCRNDYECIPTLNWWYCDTFGGQCITRECGTGEMMCHHWGTVPNSSLSEASDLQASPGEQLT